MPTNPYQPPSDDNSWQRSKSLTSVLGVIVVLSGWAAITVLACGGGFVWVVRDGLGPGSTESSGWNAVTRAFWTFYWGPVVLVACAVWGFAYLWRRRLAASDDRNR